MFLINYFPIYKDSVLYLPPSHTIKIPSNIDKMLYLPSHPSCFHVYRHFSPNCTAGIFQFFGTISTFWHSKPKHSSCFIFQLFFFTKGTPCPKYSSCFIFQLFFSTKGTPRPKYSSCFIFQLFFFTKGTPRPTCSTGIFPHFWHSRPKYLSCFIFQLFYTKYTPGSTFTTGIFHIFGIQAKIPKLLNFPYFLYKGHSRPNKHYWHFPHISCFIFQQPSTATKTKALQSITNQVSRHPSCSVYSPTF